jgi:hypothetical protein
MAVIVNIAPQVEVIDKLEQLIGSLIEDDSSVYIRTKMTLEALLSDGNITSAEKADMTAKILSDLNTSIVSASLQTALQWALKEKEVEIKVLELGRELAIHDADIQVKTASIDKMKADANSAEAAYRATYGTLSRDANGNVINFTTIGSKTAEEIKYTQAQAANTTKNTEVLSAKELEIRAGTYKVLADTRANFGSVSSYTLTDNAMLVTLIDTDDTLGKWQKELALEQSKGYGWNAWSNAVTSAAGMVSTLIASEAPDIFGKDTDGNSRVGTLALDQVNTGITKLLAIGTASNEPSVAYRSASTGKVITYDVLTLLSVEAAVGETFTLPGTVTTGAAARQITFTSSGSWTIAVAGSYSKIHLSGCAIGNMSGKICWSTSTVTETISS